jgi:rhodanese-related sulfurtransferase
VVNCAGRTRSIIGTQSLINAGVTNKVRALRNGTIGWTLAKQDLEHGANRRGEIGAFEGADANARDVAYRAGVKRLTLEEMTALQAQTHRTLYCFDVRAAEEYAAGHLPGFRHYPGGQLVQEIDMAAPVRGARIVLSDNMSVRADMTASWLAQMGWETYVLDGGYDRALEIKPPLVWPKPDAAHRYRRPYEGTDIDAGAMQAYLDWEYGLVEQLRRDGSHGFFVI